MLEDLDQIHHGIAEAFTLIRQTFPNRSLVIVSPLAEGTDRLVAEYGLSQARGRLLVPLPLPLPIYNAQFSSDESRDEFARLLAQADTVVELPLQPDRHEAYLAVGRYVVDHCDVLIAVWDGQKAQGVGGTGEIVAYTRASAKPLLIIHAVNGNYRPGDAEIPNGDLPGTVTTEGLSVS